MIPLQVKFRRDSARERLCRAWIIVNCDLHTVVSRRHRIMFLKSADWLEAAVESTLYRFGNCDQQQEKTSTIVEAYRELQQGVETLYSGGKHMREDVEILKGKIATLLDLCGIRDADIPVFEEPPPLCNRQSLITNFYTMSKKSPRSTPKLSEPVLRDPAVYGDLLLSYLLAQTDSDTSSPPDDSVASAGTEPEVLNSVNDHGNTLPRQRLLSCSSQEVHADLTPRCDKGENETPEHQNSCGGLRTPSHCSTDSLLAGSDHSNVAVVCCYSQQPAEAHFSEPQSHNSTSGSTPELPASQSSTLLDIMYASLFDSIESPDSVDLPIKGDTAPDCSQSSRHFQDSPVLPETQDLSYHERFVTPGTSESRISQTPKRSSSKEPSLVEGFFVTPVTPSHCQMKSQTGTFDQGDFIVCEPLVVCLPPESVHKSVFDKHSLNTDKHKLKVDKHNKDYKPTLVGQNPDVEQCMDAEIPPLPPRIPMTDRKISINQTVSAEVCHPGSRRINSYYSEKKMRRYLQKTPSDDVLQHGSSKSKQRVHCEQCEHEHKLHLRNSSARSKHNHQDDPEATMVASPGHSKHSRKPQSRQPQTSLTRSGSASKRRRGNDKLPVQNSHQDRQVSSARQRLKFVSPTRSGHDYTSSDSGNRQVFPIISPSTDQTEQPQKVQAHVCKMLRNHQEHKLQFPQQCTSPSPRKPVREQCNVLTCSNFAASKTCIAASASSIVSLPSREEELMDRQAYYRDLMDRDIGCYPSSRTSVSSSNKGSESPHPPDLERIARKVEGSDSPSNVPFKVPTTGMRAPRAADQGQRFTKSKVSSRGVSMGSGCSNVLPVVCVERYNSSKMTVRSDSSSQDYPASSDSPRQANSRSSLSSRSSSRSSSQKSHKYRSHPIASSTLLFDSSYISPVRDTFVSPEKSTIMSPERLHRFSPERDTMASPEKFQNFNPDRCSTITSLEGDTGSVITWTINDECSDFLDKSFNNPGAESSRRFSKRKSLHTDRGSMIPLTSTVLSRSGLTDSSSFLSPPVAAAPQPLPVKLNSTEDKHILAACNSFLQAVNTATHQKCTNSSSHAATSVRRYDAKASIVHSPSKENDFPKNVQLPHSKQISASEPDLRYPSPEDVQETDYSCVPTDTDTTSDSLLWENPPARARRPSTSSSSSCTAARCRPILLTAQLSQVLRDASSVPEEYSSLPDEDLVDSILTDSPRSVNSSGIFAPHNSYTSPVQSADSQKGYSSSSISAEPNQTVCHEYPIVPPPTPYKHERDTSARTDPPTPYNKTLTERSSLARMDPSTTPHSKTLTESSTPTQTDPSTGSRECAHPFSPLPHVSQTPTKLTRNQGVTAEAPVTPHRPQAVVSASRKGYPIMPPPAVVPAPPKIKDKNSLVRKLKQFSSHFTRRTEKLQTLANL